MSRPARAVALVVAAAVIFLVGSVRSGLVVLPRWPAAASVPSTSPKPTPKRVIRLVAVPDNPLSPVFVDPLPVPATGPVFFIDQSRGPMLQAFTWDGRAAGLLDVKRFDVKDEVAGWSPDGAVISVGGLLVDRSGRPIGVDHLGGNFAADGRHLCGLRSDGSWNWLVTQPLSGALRYVSRVDRTGPPAGDAGEHVDACSIDSDLAVITAAAGPATTRIVAVRLSDGLVLADRPVSSGDLPIRTTVSPEAQVYAENGSDAVIRMTVSGAVIRRLKGAAVDGFSADGKVAYAWTGTGLEAVEVASGRILWDHLAQHGYFNVLAVNPAGEDVLISESWCSDNCDPSPNRYLVIHADGMAAVLPGVTA